MVAISAVQYFGMTISFTTASRDTDRIESESDDSDDDVLLGDLIKHTHASHPDAPVTPPSSKKSPKRAKTLDYISSSSSSSSSSSIVTELSVGTAVIEEASRKKAPIRQRNRRRLQSKSGDNLSRSKVALSKKRPKLARVQGSEHLDDDEKMRMASATAALKSAKNSAIEARVLAGCAKFQQLDASEWFLDYTVGRELQQLYCVENMNKCGPVPFQLSRESMNILTTGAKVPTNRS